MNIKIKFVQSRDNESGNYDEMDTENGLLLFSESRNFFNFSTSCCQIGTFFLCKCRFACLDK